MKAIGLRLVSIAFSVLLISGQVYSEAPKEIRDILQHGYDLPELLQVFGQRSHNLQFYSVSPVKGNSYWQIVSILTSDGAVSQYRTGKAKRVQAALESIGVKQTHAEHVSAVLKQAPLGLRDVTVAFEPGQSSLQGDKIFPGLDFIARNPKIGVLYRGTPVIAVRADIFSRSVGLSVVRMRGSAQAQGDNKGLRTYVRFRKLPLWTEQDGKRSLLYESPLFSYQERIGSPPRSLKNEIWSGKGELSLVQTELRTKIKRSLYLSLDHGNQIKGYKLTNEIPGLGSVAHQGDRFSIRQNQNEELWIRSDLRTYLVENWEEKGFELLPTQE